MTSAPASAYRWLEPFSVLLYDLQPILFYIPFETFPLLTSSTHVHCSICLVSLKRISC